MGATAENRFLLPRSPYESANTFQAPIGRSYLSEVAAPRPLIKQESFDFQLSTPVPANTQLSTLYRNAYPKPLSKYLPHLHRSLSISVRRKKARNLPRSCSIKKSLLLQIYLHPRLTTANSQIHQPKSLCAGKTASQDEPENKGSRKTDHVPSPKASEGAVAGEICNTLCENATALLTHFKDRKMHKLLNNKNDKIPMACGWYGPDDKTQCKDVLSNSGGVCRHILESSTHLGLRRKRPARKFCTVCMA